MTGSEQKLSGQSGSGGVRARPRHAFNRAICLARPPTSDVFGEFEKISSSRGRSLLPMRTANGRRSIYLRDVRSPVVR